MTYLALFATSYYDEVPAQFGGGKPWTARILFTPSSIDQARQLGFELSPSNLLTPPVQVVWETEDSYLIRTSQTQEGSTVQIDKALVSAAVVGGALISNVDSSKATPIPEGTSVN